MDPGSLYAEIESEIESLHKAIERITLRASPLFEEDNAKIIADLDSASYSWLVYRIGQLSEKLKTLHLKAGEQDMLTWLGLIGDKFPNMTESTSRENYEDKKDIARRANSYLRKVGGAIAGRISHHVYEDPCVLYAISSWDKEGRYILESMLTKKRGISYKSVRELLPFKLIPRVTSEEAEKILKERIDNSGESTGTSH